MMMKFKEISYHYIHDNIEYNITIYDSYIYYHDKIIVDIENNDDDEDENTIDPLLKKIQTESNKKHIYKNIPICTEIFITKNSIDIIKISTINHDDIEEYRLELIGAYGIILSILFPNLQDCKKLFNDLKRWKITNNFLNYNGN